MSSLLPRYPGALIGDLWVVATGTGPALVLLHGNSESHRIFDSLVPYLGGSFTLVGIDSRAHGLSPRGAHGLTIASMADDVATTLGELGLAGVPVVGFSDGANIAIELALRHPGLASSLVLIGANLFPQGLKPRSKAVTDAAHAVSAFGARYLPDLEPLVERLGLMVHDPSIDPGDLAAIDAPALVVTGERDVILPAHTEMLAASLRRARQLVIPGVGHMVPRDAPGALALAIREHLATPTSSTV